MVDLTASNASLVIASPSPNLSISCPGALRATSGRGRLRRNKYKGNHNVLDFEK